MDFSNYITPVSITIGVLALIVIVLLAYRYLYPSRVGAPTTETFVANTKDTEIAPNSDDVDEDKKRQLLEADDMTHEQPPL